MPKDSPFFLADPVKTCLKHTYLQPDPRASMRALGRLDDKLADRAAAIFRQFIAARAEYAGRPLQVLELGCGYGVGTAMLRFPLSFAALQGRYAARELQALDPVEMEEFDRMYYASWPRSDRHRYLGADSREAAIGYAHRIGSVEHGINANLERDDPDEALAAEIQRTDVIVCRGRIGARTLARLAATARRRDPPWIAYFLPRTAPSDEAVAALTPLNLVTERFANCSFAQRRFESAAEKDCALAVLSGLGLDSAGKEADGWRHVDLHVARPVDIAASIPLDRMVSMATFTSRLPRRPQRAAV